MDRLRYQWDNQMSRGPVVMIAILGAATVALVCGMAMLVTLFHLHPPDRPPSSLPENLWTSLTRALDPGNLAQDHGWTYRIAMLLVTVGGIFIVSALISILSSGLQDKIQQLRKGRSLVVEEDHVVILGWSAKIFTILNELVAANNSRFDACIVIMAEVDKVEMEDELLLKLPKRGPTRIVCRSGNPTDPADLELVSPQRAKAIVILAPDSSHPDAETVKTILALTSHEQNRDKPYHIVVELRDSANVRLANLVGKEEVEVVTADDLVARMIVQACRQLGLSLVYAELMDFGGGEMYFHDEPRLLGRTYQECILSFRDCAVMGVHLKSGVVTVNPSQDYVLQPGDRVVVLAEDDSSIKLDSAPPAPKPNYNLEAYEVRRHPEKLLILGWNDKAPIIMRELDRYMPRGSALTLVSTYDVSQMFDEQVPMLVNLTGEYWTSPTSDRVVLEGLDISQFQHILVLAYSDHLDPQECDSQTLMTLLNLRDICNHEKLEIGLLSEMLDVRNRELAEVTRADDFIVSDRLVSMVMAQVTERKETMRIFDDLFRREGSEIFLIPAECYIEAGRTVDFYEVCHAASARGETAIGYRLRALRLKPSENYGLRLNPRKTEKITFSPGDQVIVVAVTEKMGYVVS